MRILFIPSGDASHPSIEVSFHFPLIDSFSVFSFSESFTSLCFWIVGFSFGGKKLYRFPVFRLEYHSKVSVGAFLPAV